MLKKIFLEILIFYFLTIFQISFLAHFKIPGQFLNLILISVVLINFLTPSTSFEGFEAAFLGGFFLDVFSKSPLPLSVVIFLVLVLLIKKVLRTFKIITKKFLFFSFCGILLFSIIFYNVVLNFVIKYDLLF